MVFLFTNYCAFYAMNYPKKLGFNLYQSRHCAHITLQSENLVFKKSLCLRTPRSYINL